MVTIAELLARPDSFVGKAARIEGRMTDVCPMAGCLIDGEILFPVETKGKAVEAEGYRLHMAEQLGEASDPEAESGPMALYRINGVGATIR